MCKLIVRVCFRITNTQFGVPKLPFVGWQNSAEHRALKLVIPAGESEELGLPMTIALLGHDVTTVGDVQLL